VGSFLALRLFLIFRQRQAVPGAMPGRQAGFSNRWFTARRSPLRGASRDRAAPNPPPSPPEPVLQAAGPMAQWPESGPVHGVGLRVRLRDRPRPISQ
jgi:hypothetical protein